MKIHQVKIQNLKNHRNSQFNFDSGTTIICGANGSGKSSILDAIRFTFWGSRHIRALVTTGERNMVVTVHCSVGDEYLEITRSISVSGSGGSQVSKLALVANGVDISGATIKESQALLEEKLGTEADAYATWFVQQGQLNRFIDDTPARRRETVHSILSVSPLWNKSSVEFAPEIKELRTKLEETQSTLSIRRNDLAEYPDKDEAENNVKRDSQNVKNAEEALEKAEANTKELRERDKLYVKSENSMRLVDEALKSAQERLASLTTPVEDLDPEQTIVEDVDWSAVVKAKTTRGDELANLAKAANTTADASRQKVETAKQEITDDERQIDEQKKLARSLQDSAFYTEYKHILDAYAKIDDEGDSTCELCGQPRHDEAKAFSRTMLAGKLKELITQFRIKKELRIDVLDDYNDAIKSRDAKVKDIETLVKTLEGGLVDKRKKLLKLEKQAKEDKAEVTKIETERTTVANELKEANANVASESKAQGQSAEVERQRKTAEKDVEEAQKKVDSTKEGIKREAVEFSNGAFIAFVNVSEQLTKAETAEKAANEKVTEERGNLKSSTEIRDQRKTLEGNIAKLELTERTTVAGLRVAEVVERTLSPQGARQLILDSSLKQIELLASDYLNRLGDNMSVFFSTQRESGVETLEVFVSKDGDRPATTYSGGERGRVSLCLRIAKVKVIGQRTTAGTLLMDEPFTDQDPQKLERSVSMVLGLRDVIDQVIMITHNPNLIEGADQVYRL